MKSKFDIVRSVFNHTLTKEDEQYYIDNFMSEEEKQIGKPFWKFTIEEDAKFEVLSYNNRSGELLGYDCPICKNKGLVAYLKNEYIFYKECDCLRSRNSLSRLVSSGLGNLLELYTFDRYTTDFDWQKAVKQKAIDFVDGNGKCFCMFGVSGSGKSHLCTAISKELMLKGYNLKYMVWLDECIKLKQNRMNSEWYSKTMNLLKNVDVLYIDDFFKGDNNGQPTSADINIALEIINYRYNKSRTTNKRMITIISSEKTMQDLIEIDEALAGRIRELAEDNLITITGKDKNYRFKGE